MFRPAFLALGGVVLSVVALIAVALDSPKSSEAARLNTVGEAYMNQQLRERTEVLSGSRCRRPKVADRSAE